MIVVDSDTWGKLLSSGLSGDVDSFREHLNSYCDSLDKKQHLDISNDIRELIRQNDTQSCEKSQEKYDDILERTGFSFSGVHDIVNNSPEEKEKLLHAIYEKHQGSLIELEYAEEELSKAKLSFAQANAMFKYYSDSAGLSDGIVFNRTSKEFVVVTINDDNVSCQVYKRHL